MDLLTTVIEFMKSEHKAKRPLSLDDMEILIAHLETVKLDAQVAAVQNNAKDELKDGTG